MDTSVNVIVGSRGVFFGISPLLKPVICTLFVSSFFARGLVVGTKTAHGTILFSNSKVKLLRHELLKPSDSLTIGLTPVAYVYPP